MATLLVIRTALNGEVGVAADAETSPWAPAVRTQAIIDAYADLWRAGVWKLATQTVSSSTDTWPYALTTIRRLDRIEVLDSASRVIETPRGHIEEDGSAGYQLRLSSPIPTGFSLRVRGWTAYKSQFTGDADTDDLPAEYARIPRLKAKAILWRIQLGTFARYGEKQALPPEMNVSVDQLLALVSAAEREFEEEAKRLAGLRPRSGQARTF